MEGLVMALHDSTFDYLKPSDAQVAVMTQVRATTAAYARELERLLPDGADKTFIMRKLRELAMWTNVAITRHPDGSPRAD
jgi:hypothetical protein